MADEWVYINVQVIRQETEKAFQVVLENGQIIWLPKSQISDSEDYEAGDRDVELAITQWIATEKELL